MINYNKNFNHWISIYTTILISYFSHIEQHLAKIGLQIPPISLHNSFS